MDQKLVEAVRKAAFDIHRKAMSLRECDPLDGDETSKLSELLRLELDLMNANLTTEEYEEALAAMEVL